MSNFREPFGAKIDEANKRSIDAFDQQWIDIKCQTASQPGRWFEGTCEEQVKFFLTERVAWLDRIFRSAPGKKILHCGCGTGQWSIPFAALGYHVTNLDLSSTALEITSSKFAEGRFRGDFTLGDMNNLPFSSGEFDIVMSFGVLEHFSDIKTPISEMTRVLKKDGIFFADVIPQRVSVRSVEKILQAFITIIFYTARGRFSSLKDIKFIFRPRYFENTFSSRRYAEVLRESGLGGVRAFGVRAYPFVTLPRFFEPVYVLFLKALRRIFRKFDGSGSRFSVALGVIIAFIAVKR